jgi:hypothetical protein
LFAKSCTDCPLDIAPHNTLNVRKLQQNVRKLQQKSFMTRDKEKKKMKRHFKEKFAAIN